MDTTDGQNADADIVEATAEHIDLIAPLFDAYRQFYQQLPDLPGAREFLAQRLARQESVIYLALLQAGEPPTAAGFVQLYPSFSSISMRRTWILYDLFVAPAARRHGVGKALLERARGLGASTGAAELTLQTAVDNLPAQALYESLGWKRDDQYLNYALLP
jgi:ribosomal protein S18 acetylase RimI-like enzyme